MSAIKYGITPKDELSEQDLELIRQLCLPQKIISQNMGLDIGAISMRISRLCAEFGVENRLAIVAKALQLGMVEINQLIYREVDKDGQLIKLVDKGRKNSGK